MFVSNTARTINHIVDDILRQGHITDISKKVMFVTLRLEVSKRDGDDEDALRRYVNLMYDTSSNYVLVGSQESTWPGIEDHHTWQYRSYHDSCWRYDGTETVLSEAYFAMCKEFAPETEPIKLWTSADIHRIQFREVQNVDSRRGDGLIHLEF
jgi:hypothetical protein